MFFLDGSLRSYEKVAWCRHLLENYEQGGCDNNRLIFPDSCWLMVSSDAKAVSRSPQLLNPSMEPRLRLWSAPCESQILQLALCNPWGNTFTLHCAPLPNNNNTHPMVYKFAPSNWDAAAMNLSHSKVGIKSKACDALIGVNCSRALREKNAT